GTVLDPAEEPALLAAGGQAFAAVEALAAARAEGRHHAVAGLPGGERAALEDPAGDLVPHHRAGVEPGLAAVPHVEIRAAEPGDLDADDRIAVVGEPRLGGLAEADVVWSVVEEGAHRSRNVTHRNGRV